jgi:hypothetical protein
MNKTKTECIDLDFAGISALRAREYLLVEAKG